MLANQESIQSIFARMADAGVDLAAPHVWAFFFASTSREPLERVFAELQDHNYILTDLFPADDGSGWQLNLAKTEVLTPEKLHRRNVAFNELAEYCGADLYDGWDVDVHPPGAGV